MQTTIRRALAVSSTVYIISVRTRRCNNYKAFILRHNFVTILNRNISGFSFIHCVTKEGFQHAECCKLVHTTDFHQNWPEHHTRIGIVLNFEMFSLMVFFRKQKNCCTGYTTPGCAFWAIVFILSSRGHAKRMLFLNEFFKVVPFWSY